MQLGSLEFNMEFLLEMMPSGVVSSLLVQIPFTEDPRIMQATARRLRNALLRENFLARVQNVLYTHHIGGDGQVNFSDDDWDDLWDELSVNNFCVNFPLVM